MRVESRVVLRATRGVTPARAERGGTTIVIALLVSSLVMASSFVVDLGMQRVLVADMQSLSDVVALDMVREIGGRTAGVIKADPAWTEEINVSVARNHTVGRAPTVVTKLGMVDPATGVFTEATNSQVPTAVKVIASSDADRVMQSGSGHASRSAIAEVGGGMTCFAVGGYRGAADFVSTHSLHPYLHDWVLHYALLVDLHGKYGETVNTLKNITIPLSSLAAKLGVTDPSTWATKTVSPATFLDAVAAAMRDDSSIPTVRAQLIEYIADQHQVKNASGANGSFKLDDLVHLQPGNEISAMSLQVSAYELTMGAAMWAAQGKKYQLHEHYFDAPGLTHFHPDVTLGRPAQIGCGGPGTTARSAEFTVDSHDGKLDEHDAMYPAALNIGDFGFSFTVRAATGVLQQVECRAAPSTSVTVSATSSSIESLTWENYLHMQNGSQSKSYYFTVTSNPSLARPMSLSQYPGPGYTIASSTGSVTVTDPNGATATVLPPKVSLPWGGLGLQNLVVYPKTDATMVAPYASIASSILQASNTSFGYLFDLISRVAGGSFATADVQALGRAECGAGVLVY